MDEMPTITAASIDVLERALVALRSDSSITDWAEPIFRTRAVPPATSGNYFAGDSGYPGEPGAVAAIAVVVNAIGVGLTAADASASLERLNDPRSPSRIGSHADLVKTYRDALSYARRWRDD